MSTNGSTELGPDPAISEAFSKLSELEKDFAAVELDALRQKEFSSRELYSKRSALTSAIPGFWSEILTSGSVPDEFGAILTPLDGEILSHVTSINVERYQIKSDTEGEPRSLRFTFEFGPNKFFSDTKVVKDFEYIPSASGPGGYLSKPINFKWTKDAKKKDINKLLDLAEQLYQAEQAFAQDGGIDKKEREALWQYQKLVDELEKAENEDESEGGHSFLEWFGYRGAVNSTSQSKSTEDEMSEDEDDLNVDDDILDVEIFPAGEDVALALAEELWPNVMDYFIQATTSDVEDESDEDDDDDAPELVSAADFDGFDDIEEETDPRPAKKRKTSS